MFFGSQHEYSEDMFADTRMTFGEHIEDLRLHLWRAIGGFLIALLVSFFIGKPLLRFISLPVERELIKFYDERVEQVKERLVKEHDPELAALDEAVEQEIDLEVNALAQAVARKLGLKDLESSTEKEWVSLPSRIRPLSLAIATTKAQREVGKRPGLSALSPQEAFMAYFKVCVVAGLVLGSPWIFYQIWMFVAAGLYPHEKRLVNVYLPFSLGLFLAGVLVCQFLVLPKALEALLWFNRWVSLEPDLRFNEWLGFAIMMPVVFGISFQLPLVMMVLEKIGIMTIQAYLSKWRIACFLIHVFAAVITPSVDIVSMECLALPMFGLYGLGILLCTLNTHKRDVDDDVPEPEEMVEV
jgi:sec-independent protein translocase protein TatC